MQKAEQLVQQQQQQLNTNPPLLKSKRIVCAADQQHKPTNLKRQKDFLQQHNTIYPQSENQKDLCSSTFFLLEESS
jgi:hypothetical protein